PSLLRAPGSTLSPSRRSSDLRAVVVDRPQHHRASELMTHAEELITGQPVHRDDAVVERRRAGRRQGDAGEGHAQERCAGRLVFPKIDADEVTRLESVTRFLERLSDDRVEQRLVGLEMTGGLIEDDLPARVLLDEEEAVVTLDDGGNGDVEAARHPFDSWPDGGHYG